MIAQALINRLIPSLRPSDSAEQALGFMEEYRIGQLPLVENGKYRGVIAENWLLDFATSDMPLQEVKPMFEEIFVLENQHIYELMAVAQSHPLEMLPVLDETQTFVGSIPVTELYKNFANLLGTQEQGAILVLRLAGHDYSMAEVSRLIEQNNAKIISSYFGNDEDELLQKGTLTLKLNTRNITPIIATLQRFGYEALEAHNNIPIESHEQERLDLLFRFLQI